MGRGGNSGRGAGKAASRGAAKGVASGAAPSMDQAMATIESAALSLARAGDRVYLHELRPKTGLSREAFDKAAMQMQDDGTAVLYHNDAIKMGGQAATRAAQDDAAIRLGGAENRPRHILIIDPLALRRRNRGK